jgi:hypothetical protein
VGHLGQPVRGPRGGHVGPDPDGDGLPGEGLEDVLVGPVVAGVEDHQGIAGRPADGIADPEHAVALGPAGVRLDLDDLGAVEDLEPAPVEPDGPRDLDLDAPHVIGRHVAVVDGDPQPLRLHPHPGHRRGHAGQLPPDRAEGRALGLRLGVAEAQARSFDLEAVAARVDRPGHTDASAEVADVATGDDAEVKPGRARERLEIMANRHREPRLGRTGREGREGAVVVGHDETVAAVARPVGDPVRDPRRLTHRRAPVGDPFPRSRSGSG